MTERDTDISDGPGPFDPAREDDDEPRSMLRARYPLHYLHIPDDVEEKIQASRKRQPPYEPSLEPPSEEDNESSDTAD